MLYLVPTPIGNLEDITLRALRVLQEADAVACEDTRVASVLLTLVAAPIGNLSDATPRAIAVLSSAALIACEDTRVASVLLNNFDISKPTLSYHDHNERGRTPDLIRRMTAGETIALISDAGTPAIADPGQEIVAAAHAAGHTVVPIPGASAAIAAVSASGLVEGPFIFLGFVERKGEGRRVALGKAQQTGWPVVLFESPQRLMETLADFGTVKLFNYTTFTTAIYRAWYGLFSLQSALQLSLVLVALVLLALLVPFAPKPVAQPRLPRFPWQR